MMTDRLLHALMAAYAAFTLYAATMAVGVLRYYLGEFWIDVGRFSSILLVAAVALVLIRPSRGVRWIRSTAAEIGTGPMRIAATLLILLTLLVCNLSQAVSPIASTAMGVAALIVFVVPGTILRDLPAATGASSLTLRELGVRARSDMKRMPILRAVFNVSVIYLSIAPLLATFGPAALAAPHWAAIAMPVAVVLAITVGAVFGLPFLIGIPYGMHLGLVPKVALTALAVFGMSAIFGYRMLVHTVPWVAATAYGTVQTQIFTVVASDPHRGRRDLCAPSVEVVVPGGTTTLCRMPGPLAVTAPPGDRIAITGPGTWFGQTARTSTLLPPAVPQAEI